MEGTDTGDSGETLYRAALAGIDLLIVVYLLVVGFFCGFEKAFCNRYQILPLAVLTIIFFVLVYLAAQKAPKNTVVILSTPFLALIAGALVIYFIPEYSEKENRGIIASNMALLEDIIRDPHWEKAIPQKTGLTNLSSRRLYLDFTLRSNIRDITAGLDTDRNIYVVVPKDLDPRQVNESVSGVFITIYTNSEEDGSRRISQKNDRLIKPNRGPGRCIYQEILKYVDRKCLELTDEYSKSMYDFSKITAAASNIDVEQIKSYANLSDISVEKIQNGFLTSETDIGKIKNFIDTLIAIPKEERYKLLSSEIKFTDTADLKVKQELFGNRPILIFLFLADDMVRRGIDADPSKLCLTTLN